jgi:hypothetical protein
MKRVKGTDGRFHMCSFPPRITEGLWKDKDGKGFEPIAYGPTRIRKAIDSLKFPKSLVSEDGISFTVSTDYTTLVREAAIALLSARVPIHRREGGTCFVLIDQQPTNNPEQFGTMIELGGEGFHLEPVSVWLEYLKDSLPSAVRFSIDRVPCLAIPDDKGFTVFCDGKKLTMARYDCQTDTYRLNS